MTRSIAKTKSSELICHLAEHQPARIKIIGLGGVGCLVLQFLAVFLKGLGRPVRLVLIDGDQFEPANLGRMAFSSMGNKAEVKAAETAAFLGTSDVTVAAVPEFVNRENVGRLILPGDCVFLAVDNHGTRRLVSEHAETLSDVAIFSGGNDGVNPPQQRGTYGNVQIAIRSRGFPQTAPLTQYHREIAQASGALPGDQDCGQLAASQPQIFFTNVAVASGLLNAFFAYTCEQLTYQEVQFDILEARWLPQFTLSADHVPELLAAAR
jgi:predicted ThiF/HesA family dinucleotide-utilizing enzyme